MSAPSGDDGAGRRHPAQLAALLQRQAPTLLLAVLTFVAIGLLSGATLWQIDNDRVRTLEDARRANVQLADALAEHGSRLIESVDVLLRDFSESPPAPGTGALGGDFREAYAQSLLFLRNLALLDADGRMYATLYYSEMRGRSFAGRDYYLLHRAQADAGLVVSTPKVSPADGRSRILTLSRRLNDAGGVFAGVVVASVGLDTLERYYRSIERAPGQGIELRLRDGEAMLSVGVEHNAGPDALEALRWLAGTPYGIVVSRLPVRVLADWRERTGSMLVAVAAADTLIAMLALLLGGRLHIGARLLGRLDDAERWQRTLLRTLPDPLVVLDRRLRVREVCSAQPQPFGADIELRPGSALFEVLPPVVATRVGPAAAEALGDDRIRSVDYPLHIDGELHHYAARILRLAAEDGTVEGVLWLARDITDRKRIEQALFQEKERAQVTLAAIGDGVLVTDEEARLEYLNPVAERLCDCRLAEVRGWPLAAVLRIEAEAGSELGSDPATQCLADNRPVGPALHARLMAADGRERHVEISCAPIHDPAGRPTGTVTVMHDVSERHRLTQQIRHQAAHDPLTGLINRREFELRLDAACRIADDQNRTHALLCIDLDRFKIVNDSCGHLAGDELLRQVARLMTEHTRQRDVLARMGGDEFALLLEDCPLPKAAEIAGALVSAVGEFRFVHGTQAFSIGASIGVAPVPPGNGGPQVVLSRADRACYAAKDAGRNCVSLANEDGDAASSGTRHWHERLEALLDGGSQDYELHVQPATALYAGLPPYREVLLRLRDDDGRLVPPGAFLPVADRYRLAAGLDRFVLDALCRRLAEGAGGIDGLHAMNLSVATLEDGGFAGHVRTALQRHGLAPARLGFEIEEAAVHGRLAQAGEQIGALRALGCRVTLDRCGSGLAAFDCLKVLRVDALKIDGSRLEAEGSHPVDTVSAEAIVRLARLLGLHTIASRIETTGQHSGAVVLGIDYVQGYGVCRPTSLGNPGRG